MPHELCSCYVGCTLIILFFWLLTRFYRPLCAIAFDCMLHFTALSTLEWSDVLFKTIEKTLSWLRYFIFRILKLEVPLISA